MAKAKIFCNLHTPGGRPIRVDLFSIVYYGRCDDEECTATHLFTTTPGLMITVQQDVEEVDHALQRALMAANLG